MTTNLGRESAKIFLFPTRARLAADARRAKTKSVVDLKTIQIAEVSFGSGWYHDAAIREDERNHKI